MAAIKISPYIQNRTLTFNAIGGIFKTYASFIKVSLDVVMDKQEHGDHAKCFDVITADISLELNT
jgi:hypothetical protein